MHIAHAHTRVHSAVLIYFDEFTRVALRCRAAPRVYDEASYNLSTLRLKCIIYMRASLSMYITVQRVRIHKHQQQRFAQIYKMHFQFDNVMRCARVFSVVINI